MGLRTRVPTVVLWIAVASAAAAWLWPAPEALASSGGLRGLLYADLAAGFAGWAIVMRTWLGAKARHMPPRPEGDRG
jgi:hypothetical protein